MNDPNKRIDVNISSLLSLKAELLRKQDEIHRAKSAQSMDTFVPSRMPKLENPVSLSSNSKHIADNTDNSKLSEEDAESEALLRKSKKILEMKSKHYERMAKLGGSLNSDENCLVMFNKKKQDAKIEDTSSSDDSETENFDEVIDCNGEGWVEFTDCFGRTRKCLKKDLEFMKRKDNNISNEIGPKVEESEPLVHDNENDDDEPPKYYIDVCGEAQTLGIKEQMKSAWEKKERENVDKEFIHYQDVLFDEARTHGVGYYEFSTDTVEREKQRKELDQIRDATLDEQKRRDEIKKKREKIIAERVKAFKNRQRARQGLPPLEDPPEENPSQPVYDTSQEQLQESMEQKLIQEQENEKKLREILRKQHVRPWDKGKDNVNSKSDGDSNEEWQYKPEKCLLNQNQWNEKKREERTKEFAPPVNYALAKTQFSGAEKKKHIPKTFVQRNKNIEPPVVEDEYFEEPSKSLFFTTKKSVKIKTHAVSSESIIIAEQDQSDDRIANGCEIPPPPTFNYYGPTSSTVTRKRPPSRDQLATSIEAGLKFLRNQSDKNASSGGKRVWCSKADY